MTTHTKPIGYFVHHQGRGHAERCIAIVKALPASRPVTVFTARPDLVVALENRAEIVKLPSLFEPLDVERGRFEQVTHPETTHCAPLGWTNITQAVARLTRWFCDADPALFISDVSAELAQLARISSIPHIKILQHGNRSDAGHRSAYDGAVGIIAPFSRHLAQDNWDNSLASKTVFAGGLGVDTTVPGKFDARIALDIKNDTKIILVVSGAGGAGLPEAPLAVGARATSETRWITIGAIQNDWHATPPGNLQHKGWVPNPQDFIAAADMVISSTGNTVCQSVLAAQKPWIVVPEWRYFDEQIEKARVLQREELAVVRPYFPSTAKCWTDALEQAQTMHQPIRQAQQLDDNPAQLVADWLEGLIADMWDTPVLDSQSNLQALEGPTNGGSAIQLPQRTAPSLKAARVSVLTIGRGRKTHLKNLMKGLAAQDTLPNELIIAVMNDAPYDDLPAMPFEIKQVLVPLKGGELPLATARNTAAKEASGDILLFLDIDCIPSDGFVSSYIKYIEPGAGVLMGEVGYLPRGVAKNFGRTQDLEPFAQQHAERRGPPEEGLDICKDYRCFWSLNFGMHRSDWERSGGFDSHYVGYGGEDTDYGRTCAERGVTLQWMKGGKVYHQYHDHYMPPVHHVHSVVNNAEYFASKWGHRTMEHWLRSFRLFGLIDEDHNGLRILRDASPEEREMCKIEDGKAFASSNAVLRLLEQRLTSEKLLENSVMASRRQSSKPCVDIHNSIGARP